MPESLGAVGQGVASLAPQASPRSSPQLGPTCGGRKGLPITLFRLLSERSKSGEEADL